LIDSTPGVLGAWEQFGKDYPFLNIEEILECKVFISLLDCPYNEIFLRKASHGVRSIDTLRRWLRLDSEEKLEVTRIP
jgi:hypothetical protein